MQLYVKIYKNFKYFGLHNSFVQHIENLSLDILLIFVWAFKEYTSNSNQILMYLLSNTGGVFLIQINSSTFSEWISRISFPRRRDSRKSDMREIQKYLTRKHGNWIESFTRNSCLGAQITWFSRSSFRLRILFGSSFPSLLANLRLLQ